MNDTQTFGTWLKRLRAAHDLTQDALAEQVSCAVQTIRMLEGGTRRPSRALAERVARVLDVPAEQRDDFVRSARRSTNTNAVVNVASPEHVPLGCDANGVPDSGSLFGRAAELAQVRQWLIDDRCRLVALLGIGGVGKTSLAATVASTVAPQFDTLIWRSLLNAPPLDELLHAILPSVLGPGATRRPAGIDEQLALLLSGLQRRRCLLVLDNLETILDPDRPGAYRTGYAPYGQLIQRVAESRHSSCLVLTSRERPPGVARLEHSLCPPVVRSLQLSGLDPHAVHSLLVARGLVGRDDDIGALVARYSGNPLAITLVAETVRELFAGDVGAFVSEDAVIFGDIRAVLDEQFARLTALEREVMTWLAIEREPTTALVLRASLVEPRPPWEVLEALRALQRRSLLERIDHVPQAQHQPAGATFALQNVIMEYVTGRLVDDAVGEIRRAQPNLLHRHALLKAQAKDYIRQSQARLIVQPIAERLQAGMGRTELAVRLREIVAGLRERRPGAPSYAGGNLLNLLLHLHIDVRGLDFSRLCVWQADLRGVALPASNFAQADLSGSAFTDTFDSISHIAWSPTTQILAVGSSASTIHLWRPSDWQPVGVFSGHVKQVTAVAFSPAGEHLASGGEDTTVRIWHVATGREQRVLHGHTATVEAVAYHPAGDLLATGSWDRTVRIWDAHTGRLVQTLHGHAEQVRAVAWSPDGSSLASGSWDGAVRIWDAQTGQLVHMLSGHSHNVPSVAWSPDGATLASGCWDRTVRIWDTHSGRLLRTLNGHTRPIAAVSFSPDGRMLASGGDDQGIRLWDVHAGYRLHLVCGQPVAGGRVAFSPDGRMLASGAHDQTVRIWDAHTGQPLRLLHGNENGVIGIACRPDGMELASGSWSGLIRFWDLRAGRVAHVVRGHTASVQAVAYSGDGLSFASAGQDQTVRIWDARSHQERYVLYGHTDGIRAIAFSPDGALLASGAIDRTIRLWDVRSGRVAGILDGHSDFVQTVAFSPDGRWLASAGNDGTLYVWDLRRRDGFQRLSGHTGVVVAVAFSPDGRWLASGSWDRTVRMWELAPAGRGRTLCGHTAGITAVAFSADGRRLASAGGHNDQTLRVWDTATGRLLHVLHGHAETIAFRDSVTLISGSVDETIKGWDVERGECLQTMRAEAPYAGMNITAVAGITEAQKLTLKALGAVDDSPDT